MLQTNQLVETLNDKGYNFTHVKTKITPATHVLKFQYSEGDRESLITISKKNSKDKALESPLTVTMSDENHEFSGAEAAEVEAAIRRGIADSPANRIQQALNPIQFLTTSPSTNASSSKLMGRLTNIISPLKKFAVEECRSSVALEINKIGAFENDVIERIVELVDSVCEIASNDEKSILYFNQLSDCVYTEKKKVSYVAEELTRHGVKSNLFMAIPKAAS